MVKFERPAAPAKLTPTFVADQTAKFKADGSAVWNVDWLKEALVKMTNDKCSYCECNVTKAGAYMEVEHFVGKDQDKDQVLKWENLLPACKRCNVNKLDHDVLSEPIVNPAIDDPALELSMKNYRIRGRTTKGKKSVEVLDLNEATRLVVERFEIGDALEQTLETAISRMEQHKERPIPVRRTKLTGIMRQVLKECQPDSTYSATCSTVLHSSPEYDTLKSYLNAQGLWDAEMDAMDKKSFKTKLS